MSWKAPFNPVCTGSFFFLYNCGNLAATSLPKKPKKQRKHELVFLLFVSNLFPKQKNLEVFQRKFHYTFLSILFSSKWCHSLDYFSIIKDINCCGTRVHKPLLCACKSALMFVVEVFKKTIDILKFKKKKSSLNGDGAAKTSVKHVQVASASNIHPNPPRYVVLCVWDNVQCRQR